MVFIVLIDGNIAWNIYRYTFWTGCIFYHNGWISGRRPSWRKEGIGKGVARELDTMIAVVDIFYDPFSRVDHPIIIKAIPDGVTHRSLIFFGVSRIL